MSQSEKAWENTDKIVKNIEYPQFKDTVFNVKDFGAVTDGKTNN